MIDGAEITEDDLPQRRRDAELMFFHYCPAGTVLDLWVRFKKENLRASAALRRDVLRYLPKLTTQPVV